MADTYTHSILTPFDTCVFICHMNPPTSQKQLHFPSITAKSSAVTLAEQKEVFKFYLMKIYL